MYTLSSEGRVESRLIQTPPSANTSQVKHDILKDAIKQDPSLIIDLAMDLPEFENAGDVYAVDESVGQIAHTKLKKDVMLNADVLLARARPNVIQKLINRLRASGEYRAFLTVSPPDAEKKVVYGGTSGECLVRLWILFDHASSICIAECRTRNKQDVRGLISNMLTNEKVRARDEYGSLDLYYLEHAHVPQKLRFWNIGQ